jgi:hypothetical protein
MQASRCHALWILAILALMAWPPSVAAVGEYDGVWIGTETVYVEGESPETFNTETKTALILVERAKASPWIPLLLGD